MSFVASVQVDVGRAIVPRIIILIVGRLEAVEI